MREGRHGRASVVAGPAFLALVLCLIPADASAYIDPGTGSYVFQTVVAALIIKRFFRPIYDEFCVAWKKSLANP